MRFFASCFVFLLVLALLTGTAVAGDVPESIIANENADVILGTVTRVEGGMAAVEVARSMFGVVKDDEITLEDLRFRYVRDGEALMRKAEAGDLCALGVIVDEDGKVSGLYGGLASLSDGLEPETATLTSYGDFIERMNVHLKDGMYSPERRAQLLATAEADAVPANAAMAGITPAAPRFSPIPVLSSPEATPVPNLAPEPAQIRIAVKRNYVAAVIVLAVLFVLCVAVYIYQRVKNRS